MGKKSQKKKREKMPGGKPPGVSLKEISLTRVGVNSHSNLRSLCSVSCVLIKGGENDGEKDRGFYR